MATLNIEIYEALREAKVLEDSARKPATAVAELGGSIETTELKADVRTLRADVADLKSDMRHGRSTTIPVLIVDHPLDLTGGDAPTDCLIGVELMNDSELLVEFGKKVFLLAHVSGKA
jgi:hypothetical protein